jgi:ABC-type transporter Mla subunit MlaD
MEPPAVPATPQPPAASEPQPPAPLPPQQEEEKRQEQIDTAPVNRSEAPDVSAALTVAATAQPSREGAARTAEAEAARREQLKQSSERLRAVEEELARLGEETREALQQPPEVVRLIAQLMSDYQAQIRRLREEAERGLVQAVLQERQVQKAACDASLEAQARAWTEQLQQRLREQAQRLHDDLGQRLDQLQQEARSLHQERAAQLDQLHEKLRQYQAVLRDFSQTKNSSLQVTRLCLATLALEDALLREVPLTRPLRELEALAATDPHVRAVLARAVGATDASGSELTVRTLPQLAAQFRHVQKVARRVALVPEDAGLWWHLFGGLIAAVTRPPRGPVEGSEPDAVLARAEHHLHRGDLSQCLRELQTLPPQAREVTRDWEAAVRHRLRFEQAASLLRAHALSEAARLAGAPK